MLPLHEARHRLRSLADDWEARARRSTNADARCRYHRAASDARRDAAARYMGEGGLRLALEAAAAQAVMAAWFDGDVLGIAPRASDHAALTADAVPPPVVAQPAFEASPGALNARELAALYGMTERGARKRITHCFDRGQPGFYFIGGRRFADPAAFGEFRMSSGRADGVKPSP